MARVICTLPNASGEINGVVFEDHDEGKISVDVSDEVAAAFTGIKGYRLAVPKAAAIKGVKAQSSAAAVAPVVPAAEDDGMAP